MNCPKLKGSVVFRQEETDDVTAVDLQTGKKCTLSADAAEILLQMDGYHEPDQVSSSMSEEEILNLIDYIDQLGFFRTHRVDREPFASLRVMLWERDVNEPALPSLKLLNLLFVILCLPLFLAGVCAALSALPRLSFDLLGAGLILGIIGSAFFHELGHVLPALAYGASVCEVGLMLKFAFIPSVYVLIDDGGVKKRMQRIQIALGGAEANFALAGISMIFAAIFPALGGMFLLSALINVLFALLNLTFFEGSDGMCVLEELLGVYDLMKKAGTVVKNRRIRRKILKQGIYGAAIVALCYVLWVMQIGLPIILLSNVLEVIVCFV